MPGTVWFVAEPETHSHIPRDPSILLFSVVGLIVSCYVLAVPLRFVFRYITNRNKTIKPVTEYTIVIFITIFFISLITIFFNFLLNPQPFFQRISWYDLVRNNGLVTPLVFLIYLYKRNALIKEEYNRQTLQLPDPTPQTEKTTTGIGIENSKRRLALLYPDRHDLNISVMERKFIVELILIPDFDAR